MGRAGQSRAEKRQPEGRVHVCPAEASQRACDTPGADASSAARGQARSPSAWPCADVTSITDGKFHLVRAQMLIKRFPCRGAAAWFGGEARHPRECQWKAVLWEPGLRMRAEGKLGPWARGGRFPGPGAPALPWPSHPLGPGLFASVGWGPEPRGPAPPHVNWRVLSPPCGDRGGLSWLRPPQPTCWGRAGGPHQQPGGGSWFKVSPVRGETLLSELVGGRSLMFLSVHCRPGLRPRVGNAPAKLLSLARPFQHPPGSRGCGQTGPAQKWCSALIQEGPSGAGQIDRRAGAGFLVLG